MRSSASSTPPLMDPPPFSHKRRPPQPPDAAPLPLAVVVAPPRQPPSSTSSAFYKTRLCQKFCATGSCHYGDSCTFAHGAEDVRPPPPHWHDAAAPAPAGRPHPNPRGRICRKFFAGEVCPYGEGCSYLHVRRDGSPARGNAGGLGRPSRSSEERGSSHQSSSWSRDMKRCRDWENAGRRANEERFGSARGSAVFDTELKQPAVLSEGNMEKSGSVARGTPSTSTNELIPGKTESGSLQKTPKSFWHLDGIKKLNGIYADWID